MSIQQRHVAFAAVVALSIVLFWPYLRNLCGLALENDHYSHLLIVLPVVAYFVWLNRTQAFAHVTFAVGWASPLFLVATGLCLLPLALSDRVGKYESTLRVVAIVLIWIGSFLAIYGLRSLGAVRFSALFLLLLIPPPDLVLDRVIATLQWMSTEASYLLFRVAGVPVFRHGFTLSLPGVDIEVAQECSGIRSSASLTMLSVILGKLFLHTGIRRLLLVGVTIPVVVFKNALRIVTIGLLGTYVDSGFFHGRLHRYSGLPFSLLAIMILMPLFLSLLRSERASQEYAPRD